MLEDRRMERLIKLGDCHRPHGLKGGMVWQLASGDKTILKKGMKVFLSPLDEKSALPSKGRKYLLAKISVGKKNIAYLNGIADRNGAEALLPFSIFLDRSEFPALKEDEFYFSDLLGLKVIDHSSKAEVGTVAGVGDNSLQAVLEVRGQVNVDLPLVNNFFPVVNVERGFIEMVWDRESGF